MANFHTRENNFKIHKLERVNDYDENDIVPMIT